MTYETVLLRRHGVQFQPYAVGQNLAHKPIDLSDFRPRPFAGKHARTGEFQDEVIGDFRRDAGAVERTHGLEQSGGRRLVRTSRILAVIPGHTTLLESAPLSIRRYGIVKLLSRRDEFRNPERNGRGSDNKCPRLCILRYIGDLIPERKRLSTHVPVRPVVADVGAAQQRIAGRTAESIGESSRKSRRYPGLPSIPRCRESSARTGSRATPHG
nr:hypothetical protein [uncultured bacterium]